MVSFDIFGDYESWASRTHVVPSPAVAAPSTMRVNLRSLFDFEWMDDHLQNHITHFENSIPSVPGGCIDVNYLPWSLEVLRSPVLPEKLIHVADLIHNLKYLVSLDLSAHRIFDHKYNTRLVSDFAMRLSSDTLERLVIPIAAPRLKCTAFWSAL
eukprot:tig00021176_g19185.t1